MAGFSVISSKGLASNVNPLGVSPGVNLIADNVRIEAGGVIRPRRGQDLITRTSDKVDFGVDPDNFRPEKMAWYNNRPWVYQYNSNSTSTILGYMQFTNPTTAGQWRYTKFSEDLRVDSGAKFKPQIFEACRRLCLSTKYGLYVSPKLETDVFTGSALDTRQTSMRLAGCPPAYQPWGVALVDTTSPATYGANQNWLPVNSKVAYRVVWRRTDENGNDIYGEPSGRIIVTNTAAAARAVSFKVIFPIDLNLAIAAGDYAYAAQFTCEIHRTRTSSVDVSGTAPDPGDEMFGVSEHKPTGTEIAAGTFNFTDIIQDSVLQQPLYTNESQDGQLMARRRVPVFRSGALFNNCAFFGNTTDPWTMELDLLAVSEPGVPTPFGLQDQDLVVIGDQCLVGVTGAVANAWEFKIDTTTGAGSQITRSLNTANNIINTFNQNLQNYSSNGYQYKFYMGNLAGPNDYVGRMGIFERVPGTANGLYVGCSRVDAVPQFSPAPLVQSTGGTQNGLAFKITQITAAAEFITSTNHDFTVGDTINLGYASSWVLSGRPPPGVYTVSGTPTSNKFTVTGWSSCPAAGPFTVLGGAHLVRLKSTGAQSPAVGESQRRKNRVYFSPEGEPESAPVMQWFEFGRTDAEILKMARIGESLMIFKEDGLHRVTGYYGSFFQSLFDENCKLIAPESVASMGGSLYALTSNGIAKITESSVDYISEPIDDLINRIVWGNGSAVALESFGVGYEDDGTYTLWMPEVGKTRCSKAFVWNGSVWYTRSDQATHGCVGLMGDFTGDIQRLYTAKDKVNWITQERKSMSVFDYADEQLPANLVSVTSANLQFNVILGSYGAGSWTSGGALIPYLDGAIFRINGRVDYRIPLEAGSSTFFIGNYTSLFPGAIGGREGVIPNAQVPYTDWPAASSADVFLGFTSTVTWVHQDQDEPNSSKQFGELALHFEQPFFTFSQATIQSDQSSVAETLSSKQQAMRGFADGIYNAGVSASSFPWTIRTYDPTASTWILGNKTIRMTIPRGQQRASQLLITWRHWSSWEYWALFGYSMQSVAGGKNIARDNNA